MTHDLSEAPGEVVSSLEGEEAEKEIEAGSLLSSFRHLHK